LLGSSPSSTNPKFDGDAAQQGENGGRDVNYGNSVGLTGPTPLSLRQYFLSSPLNPCGDGLGAGGAGSGVPQAMEEGAAPAHPLAEAEAAVEAGGGGVPGEAARAAGGPGAGETHGSATGGAPPQLPPPNAAVQGVTGEGPPYALAPLPSPVLPCMHNSAAAHCPLRVEDVDPSNAVLWWCPVAQLLHAPPPGLPSHPLGGGLYATASPGSGNDVQLGGAPDSVSSVRWDAGCARQELLGLGAEEKLATPEWVGNHYR